MNRAKLKYWFFNSMMAAAALYLLAHNLPGPGAAAWFTMAVFAVLIFSLASLKLFLPIEDVFSFEYVMIIPCVLTYGFGALWPVAVGAAGYMAVKKAPFSEAVYYVGSAVLATWSAAAIFVGTGGIVGKFDLTGNYSPLLGFFSALLITVFGFRAVYESLLADRPMKIFHFLKDESSTALLVLVDGIVAVALYQSFGWAGIGMVLFLTVGIWKTLKTGFHSEQKYINTVEAFLSVTENKIPHFRGHSERVARYCQMMMGRLRVSREDKCLVEYAALLHDIGKLGMPENLLRVHSYLTSEEVQTLETHTEIGYRLAKQISGLGKVADLIYCHHERFDGEGYPRRIRGEGIPFGARVIAAADVFDNLLNRVGLRYQQALTELKNMAGAELDPAIVDAFLQALLAENQDFGSSDCGQFNDSLEERTRDIVQQLRYYLDKSWVLGTLRVSCIVIWEQGEIKNLGSGAISDSVKDYLREYVSKGLEVGTCCKEFVIDSASAKILSAYFMPVSKETCLITVLDMTEVLKTEKDREDRELQIYRDVILAVTQGKFLLAFGDEIDSYTGAEEPRGRLRLREPADVGLARTLVRDAVKDVPLTGQRKTRLILCVSEAATNVIKHVGEGYVSVYVLPNLIRVIVADNGPGIDVSQLPQVTLRKGYSTKISLGLGFTVMLDYLDRLVMSTRNNGTVLVMEMNYSEETAADQVPERKEVMGQDAC